MEVLATYKDNKGTEMNLILIKKEISYCIKINRLKNRTQDKREGARNG